MRDDVIILVGPDKGKTGRVLWVARIDGKPKHLVQKTLQRIEHRTANLWTEASQATCTLQAAENIPNVGCGCALDAAI